MAACFKDQLAGGRQAQGREEAVEHVDLAARHHGEGAAELVLEVAEQRDQGGGDFDRLGRGREAHQGAVEIEEEGRVPAQGRRQRIVAADGIGHRERP